LKKPNIILFITHDQGQFLGCYDTPQTPNSLHTPNLDKLAKNGIRFTNYFCTAPQCSPSRGSIQTSLYPHQNGLMGLVNLGWTLPPHNKTMPMYLKESGYSTHLLGLQHESIDVNTLGYETVSKRMKDYKYDTKIMLSEYEKFFEKHKNDEQPFFANLGVIEIHRPFDIWSEPVDSKKVIIPPFLPDSEKIREDLGLFYGIINPVDETIGKIIDILDRTGLRDNTLFIYTTDHGSPFPRAKCTLYDPGIKTLLIMNCPNNIFFSGGKVFEQMISNIDLMPTLLDFIGAEIPENIEGKSFLPILKATTLPFRSEIYTEKSYHNIYDPMRSVRTKEYKYIRNFESSQYLYEMPIDIERSLSGQDLKDKIKMKRNEEEFYDLKEDPLEFNNLAYNLAYNDVLLELRQKLYNWMEKTNDPLLKGKIKDERQKPPRKY
jgi:N-sulfoglucosamine sulfohydrolase